jgi:hypothetical protein
LLPNNSDETARTLTVAGSWIKSLDPETADLFYKALVRRCRKTRAGAEAERIRWFPNFNEKGEVIARKTRQVKLDMPPAEADSPGESRQPIIHDIPFVLEAGDTLQVIADAMTSIGQPLTVKQIIDANPGLEPSKLRIGQRILIPIR